MSAWLVLGVSLLLAIVAFFLQRRRDWKGIVFFLLGLCVILSGIGGYYLKFNRFKQQIDEEGWRDSMLQWVDEYNDGRDGVGLMQYTATAYLYSWEWTMPWQERFVDARALKLLHAAGEVIGVLLVAGLVLGVRRRGDRLGGDMPAEAGTPAGTPMLWILAWIVVPAYAFYCVSDGTIAGLSKMSGRRGSFRRIPGSFHSGNGLRHRTGLRRCSLASSRSFFT